MSGAFRLWVACVTVQAHSHNRKKLLNLLEEINAAGELRLAEDVNSLIEIERFSGRGQLSVESLRRRGGHAACECPDAAGDMLSVGCLSRRNDLVKTNLNLLNSLNSSLGLSIEGGRMHLREEFAGVLHEERDRAAETESIAGNFTTPRSGYVFKVDDATIKLLNEETMMVESANHAWMNMVNVSKLVDGGSSELTSKIKNSTDSIIAWFNKLQLSQEQSSWTNLKKTASLARGSLRDSVNGINAAKSLESGSVAVLDKSLEKAVSTVESLVGSLTSASESVSGELQSFNQSMPSTVSGTTQAIKRTLNQLVQQYQAMGGQQVGILRSTAERKISNARNATGEGIVSQSSSAINSLAVARNVSQKSIKRVVDKQAVLTASLLRLFSELSSKIQSGVSANSSLISGQVRSNTAAISNASDLSLDLKGKLAAWNRSEATETASAKVKKNTYETGAVKKFSDLSAAATSKRMQTQTAGKQLAADSVSAVGTAFQTKADALGFDTNGLISSLVDQSGSAARASASSMNQLAKAATSASVAVSVAKKSLSDSVSVTVADVLASVGAIPERISAATEIQVRMQSALANATNNASSMALEAKSIKALSLALSAGNHTASEKKMSSFLNSISKDEEKSKVSVNKVSSAVRGSSSTSVRVSAQTGKVAKSNSQVLSLASSRVAKTADSAVKALSKPVTVMAKKSETPLRANIAPRLAQSLRNAGDQLHSGQASIDSVASTVKKQTKSGVEALEDSRTKSMQANQKAQSTSLQNSRQLQGSQDKSLADVNQVAATASLGAADSVGKQVQRVAREKTEAALKAKKLAVDQLQNTKVHAVNIDSLNFKVDGYMNENVGALAMQSRALIPSASTLLLRLQKQKADATDIAKEGAKTSDWSAIVDRLASLMVRLNASAGDALTEVGVKTNRSLDQVQNQVHLEISNMASQFSRQASGLEAQLSRVEARAVNQNASTSNNFKIVDQIGNISANLSAVANQSNSALVRFRQSSLPSNFSAIFGKVTQIQRAAEASALAASAVITQLANKASTHVTAINKFNLTDGLVNPADVVQQAGLATMTENVASANLALKQTALTQISGSSTNLTSDYQNEVLAQTASSRESATGVYNRVVQGKSNVVKMVGGIAAQYAAQLSSIGANSSVSEAKRMTGLASTRQRVTALLNSFDAFSRTSNSTFGLGLNDFNSVAVERLGYLKSKLGSLRQNISNNAKNLKIKVNDLNSTLYAISKTQLDVFRESLQAQFTDWISSNQNSFNTNRKTLSSLAASIPINISTITQKTNYFINSFATTAQALLKQFKLTNKKLNDIVVSSAKNMTQR